MDCRSSICRWISLIVDRRRSSLPEAHRDWPNVDADVIARKKVLTGVRRIDAVFRDRNAQLVSQQACRSARGPAVVRQCRAMKTKPPNPVDGHVGSRMRMRRMMLGMTQDGLAKAFGLTFQEVQKDEKGLNRMGSSQLQQTAEVLRVDIPFFFKDGSGGQVTAAAPLTRIDSGRMRRAIVGLVQELAEPE